MSVPFITASPPSSMQQNGPTIEEFISSDDIHKRVLELAIQIENDFCDEKFPLLLVGVLNGAAIFLADLVRAIHRPVEYDFVAFSSYQSGTETSGVVHRLKELSISPAAKNVILIEDILDTGVTLRKSGILESLAEQRALSVHVCVLLDKPSRRRVDITADYVGFTIPDQFVVGYGMDFDQRYRSLPYIGIAAFDNPK